MRIAVNTIFLQKNNLEGYGYFVQEIFSRLAAQHPEHEFIFIFDRPYDDSFIVSNNIQPIIVKPKARHAIAFKYWYDVKLPLALRFLKVNLLIQPFGFCSLTTSIPQLLVVHDLAFKHYPQFIPKYHLYFYQLFTKAFLKKAQKILTVSAFSKADIVNQYKIPEKKIDIVYSAAKPIFKLISFEEKQTIKKKFSNDAEFFLFTGGIHPRKNLITLLKAFSLFKKMQKSNMKLLVAGRVAWKANSFIEKLKSYKYKDDVVLLGYINEVDLATITASAYAVIFPSFFEGFGVPIIEAMQCGVPVITSNTSSMPEIGGNAALYTNPTNPSSIAEAMKNIYKDENLRSQLISLGLEQAKQFSWDRTASLFWNSILDVTAKAKQ